MTTTKTTNKFRQPRLQPVAVAPLAASTGDASRVETMLHRIVTPDAAKRWLTTPNALLGGSTPHEAIQRGETERVVEMLASMEQGIYV